MAGTWRVWGVEARLVLPWRPFCFGARALPTSWVVRPMRTVVAILGVALFLLAGCSDNGDGDDGADDGAEDGAGGVDGDGSGSAPDETPTPEIVQLEVSLSGAYPVTIAYDPAVLSVPAGSNVTLTFLNNDQNPLIGHDWALEGFEETAKTVVVGNGDSTSITFTAPTEPGDYVFYCSVPGHRDNGMEGTFTVT